MKKIENEEEKSSSSSYRLSKKDKMVITKIRVHWSEPYLLVSFSARKTHPISDKIAMVCS